MNYFNVCNFLIYQSTWLVAAFYPNSGAPFIAILITAHFIFSPSKLADFRLLNIAIIGCFIDGVLIHFNILITDNNELPITLVLLWCVFAFTFNHCLRWLSHLHLKYISLIGLVLGPASYYGALNLNTFETKLTDIQFISLYAFIWALILPLFIKYCTSINFLFSIDNEVKQQ